MLKESLLAWGNEKTEIEKIPLPRQYVYGKHDNKIYLFNTVSRNTMQNTHSFTLENIYGTPTYQEFYFDKSTNCLIRISLIISAKVYPLYDDYTKVIFETFHPITGERLDFKTTQGYSFSNEGVTTVNVKDGVYGFYFTGKSVSSQVENHRMVVYFPKFKKLVDIDLSALNIEERFSSQPYNYQYQYGSSLFDIEYDEYRILTFSLATKLCSSIQPKIYQCYYNGTLNAKSTTFEAYSLKNGYPHKFTAKYPFHGANDGSAWKHLPVKHSFSMIPYILGIYNETYLFTLGTVNNGNSRISHI